MTLLNRHRSCAKSTSTSLPRKIFATNAPPGLSTQTVRLSALRSSDACTYSSRSWRPVTSGAPSHMTKSAFDPAPRCLKTSGRVLGWVMSACNVTTPGIGVIGWRSRAMMVLSVGRWRERTWLHDPGAAQRSITRGGWSASLEGNDRRLKA